MTRVLSSLFVVHGTADQKYYVELFWSISHNSTLINVTMLLTYPAVIVAMTVMIDVYELLGYLF